jgi:hypothetical protein
MICCTCGRGRGWSSYVYTVQTELLQPDRRDCHSAYEMVSRHHQRRALTVYYKLCTLCSVQYAALCVYVCFLVQLQPPLKLEHIRAIISAAVYHVTQIMRSKVDMVHRCREATRYVTLETRSRLCI